MKNLTVFGSKIFIVEEGANPSTDFFVLPALRLAGVSDVVHCGFDDLPSQEELDNACVIFVRYVPTVWQRFVTTHRSRLAAVYFFMDDDLFDRSAFSAMPLNYYLKLLRYSWLRKNWLKKMGTQLWVSTPYLAAKYADWQPVLLEPYPALSESQVPMKTVFYHGSASHIDDVRWLYPVVEEVLQRNDELVFEIIGNSEVNRLFRRLSRVQVLYPMKWTTYQALLKRPGRSIGLAPLLNTPFNRARSHTKFIDITEAGAVGVYAAGSTYSSVVEHEVNGLLLDMEPELWVDAILDLASDSVKCAQLLEGAQRSLSIEK